MQFVQEVLYICLQTEMCPYQKNQPKLYGRVEDLFKKATIAKFQGFEYSEYKLV